MADIRIEPSLWDDDIEGVITAWLFDDGDAVDSGDIVAEIMVEKVQHEIKAPVSGILKIEVAVEEPIRRGDRIGEIV